VARFEPHPERRPAVITGASSGIGEATARALAAAGHPVVLGARRVERCQAVAGEINAQGGEAAAAHLDVSDGASIKDFAAAAESLGPVEVFVANAGDTALATGVDTPPEDFAAQLQVNLLAVQHLISLLVPGMVHRRRGDLVLISSDVLRAPRPGIAPYVSAKWGLEGLGRALQMELEGTGVRASIVRPGPTMTEMGREWNPDQFAAAVDEWVKWGLARHDGFMQPADVAHAVVAVVSMPRGAHITLLEVEPEGPIVE
jgi:NADP-dependent 3-hydroxy acid dehydrogenase YdfG